MRHRAEQMLEDYKQQGINTLRQASSRPAAPAGSGGKDPSGGARHPASRPGRDRKRAAAAMQDLWKQAGDIACGWAAKCSGAR